MDNTLTYALERSYFDRALADERGIRIPFDDYGDARALQLRLHKARQQDRRANRRDPALVRLRTAWRLRLGRIARMLHANPLVSGGFSPSRPLTLPEATPPPP